MHKVIFWLASLSSTGLLFYSLSNTLMPFFISFIAAYALHPVIDKAVSRFKISRNLAVIIVFIIFFCVLAVLLTIIIPALYQQLVLLINKVPIYKTYFINNLSAEMIADKTNIDSSILLKINEFIHEIINTVFTTMLILLNNVWSYTIATVNVLVLCLLVPVILFFFLRDWPSLIRNLENLIPLPNRREVRRLFNQIDQLLAAYIRGQLNICLILAVYYSIGLAIIGLDQAILLGVLSGFLIIIPYIGALLSFCITILIGYFTFGFEMQLGCVLMLYAIGHFFESCIFTPKIIGNKIGLHPLWVIFSVMAFGSLFGLSGVFFAIPLAGVINILVGYGLTEYKSSNFYQIK